MEKGRTFISSRNTRLSLKKLFAEKDEFLFIDILIRFLPKELGSEPMASFFTAGCGQALKIDCFSGLYSGD